jgi:putative SOS response-associated peptidase YedK
MPVILTPAIGAAWLDANADPAALQKLLKSYTADAMDAYPVSMPVGSPRNHGPELIQPLAS